MSSEEVGDMPVNSVVVADAPEETPAAEAVVAVADAGDDAAPLDDSSSSDTSAEDVARGAGPDADGEGEGDGESGDDDSQDEGDDLAIHDDSDSLSSGDDDSPDDYDDSDDDDDDDDDDADITQKMSELRGMMNSFYAFSPPSQFNAVDQTLAREEFTLEDLLDLDDFMPDLRRGKAKLLKYLVQPEVLMYLVTYISAEKYPEHLDQEKCKRYGHLAYEAIQSEVLKEAMIKDTKMLDKFFEFLDIQTAMDPLRCAYFSRIVELLFERYPKELINYLAKEGTIVEKFVMHINNQYIVESLFRLIDSQVSHQWLHEEDLIPLLMSQMAMCEDPETQEKTAGVFVELLDLFVPFPYSILTTQMFHSEIVAEQWESFTLHDKDDHARIQNGLNVAIGILNLSYEGNMAEETPIFMQTVTKNISFFLDLLKTPASDRSFRMTFGELSPPFGFLRLKVLEFLGALLNTRYQAVMDALWREDLFNTLLDICFHYKWNNMLHFYFDHILSTMIALDVDGEQIRDILIIKCNLLDRIMDALENETDRTTGYLGQLVRVAQELTKASAYHDELAKVMEQNTRWGTFVDTTLKDILDRNSRPLVERPPGIPDHESFTDYGVGGGQFEGDDAAFDNDSGSDDDIDLLENATLGGDAHSA